MVKLVLHAFWLAIIGVGCFVMLSLVDVLGPSGVCSFSGRLPALRPRDD